jgi:hypothetical protein
MNQRDLDIINDERWEGDACCIRILEIGYRRRIDSGHGAGDLIEPTQMANGRVRTGPHYNGWHSLRIYERAHGYIVYRYLVPVVALAFRPRKRHHEHCHRYDDWNARR